MYDTQTPDWLGKLPAVEIPRRVLVQNYHLRTDTHGREVITRREADTDGLPPGRARISSPYDIDTRWAAKGEDLYWNGYKVHLSETCPTPHTADTDTAHTRDDTQAGQQPDAPAKPEELPNLITNVATTDATVPDVAMTKSIHQTLKGRDLLPGQHYLDSGYPCAELMTRSRTEFGIEPITPHLATTHHRPKPAPDTTAPASPSTSTTSKPPAPKGTPAPHGTQSPNAAPTPS